MRSFQKNIVIILYKTVEYNYSQSSNKSQLIQSFIKTIINYFFNEFLLYNKPLLFLGSEESVHILSGKTSQELITQINSFWRNALNWIQWNFFDTQSLDDLSILRNIYIKTPEHQLIPLIKDHIIGMQLMLMCLSLNGLKPTLNINNLHAITHRERSILTTIPTYYNDRVIISLFLLLVACQCFFELKIGIAVTIPLILYKAFYLSLKETKINNSKTIINKCLQLESILNKNTKRNTIEDLCNGVEVINLSPLPDFSTIESTTEIKTENNTPKSNKTPTDVSQHKKSEENNIEKPNKIKKDSSTCNAQSSYQQHNYAFFMSNRLPKPYVWESMTGKKYIYTTAIYRANNNDGSKSYRAYPLFKDGIIRAFMAASDPDNCPEELAIMLTKGRFQRSTASGVKYLANKKRYEMICDTKSTGGNDRRYLSLEEIPSKNTNQHRSLILFDIKARSHNEIRNCRTNNGHSPR